MLGVFYFGGMRKLRFQWLFLVPLLSACSLLQPKPMLNSHWPGIYQLQIRTEARSEDWELLIKSNGKVKAAQRDWRNNTALERFKGIALNDESGVLKISFGEFTLQMDTSYAFADEQHLGNGQWRKLNNDTSIFNSSWRLNLMQGYSYAAHGGHYSLSFGPDSTYGGHDGCNGFGGRAEIDSVGHFKIKEMISTLLYCEPHLYGDKYTAKLGQVHKYKVHSYKRLSLHDSLGNALMFLDRSLMLD